MAFAVAVGAQNHTLSDLSKSLLARPAVLSNVAERPLLLRGIQVVEVKRRRVIFATVKAVQRSFVFLNKAPHVGLAPPATDRYRRTIAVIPGSPVATDLISIRFSPGGTTHQAILEHMF